MNSCTQMARQNTSDRLVLLYPFRQNHLEALLDPGYAQIRCGAPRARFNEHQPAAKIAAMPLNALLSFGTGGSNLPLFTARLYQTVVIGIIIYFILQPYKKLRNACLLIRVSERGKVLSPAGIPSLREWKGASRDFHLLDLLLWLAVSLAIWSVGSKRPGVIR